MNKNPRIIAANKILNNFIDLGDKVLDMDEQIKLVNDPVLSKKISEAHKSSQEIVKYLVERMEA